MVASDLQPNTLMQAVAKIIAYQANQVLTGLAEASVASPQRGSVKNRSISEHIVEFEGRLCEHSQGVQDPAGILLDCQMAPPQHRARLDLGSPRARGGPAPTVSSRPGPVPSVDGAALF